MRAWIAVVAASVVLAGAGEAWAQSQPTGSFANEASGETFYQGAMVSDGTYVYTVGGYQAGTVSAAYFYYARCRRYDPVNNSWLELPQIASGTSTWGSQFHSAAYHGGRIFMFGGYNYLGTTSGATTTWSFAYTSAIRAFTISTGTWTTLPAVLNGGTRYNSAAVTASTPIGDRIYVTGGQGSALNDEFNPATNTVTARAALPNNAVIYYHTMAALPSQNRVFVLGGVLAGAATGLCYEYNLPSSATDQGSWTVRTPITLGTTGQFRYYHAAAALNNRIYLFGGYVTASGSTTISNSTVEYNPATDSWAQRASMSVTRYLHSAAVVGTKAYIYGGGGSQSVNEEYTPPDFGSAPTASSVGQSGSRPETALQSAVDVTAFDGWTNGQVSITGTITDPNAGQQVRLRVQVKPSSAAWSTASAITNLDSGLVAQGTVVVNYAIPTDGSYDWRWRAEDTYGNSDPIGPATTAAGWNEAFGNGVSPDFRSDQIAPADPVAVSPTHVDFQVPDPAVGDVVLNWIESTDNGPVGGISYELQVARDPGFLDIEAQLFSTAGTSSYPVTLSVSRYEKHWRIRARDVGGNFSAWSPPLSFRVTFNDGANHGAGDGKKSCGMSAAASRSGLLSALLGVLVLGFAVGARRVRG